MTEILNIRELLAKLVSFPTLSHTSNLALIDFVEDYLSHFGITSQRVFNDDQTKAGLYAVVGPQVPGGVILSGHTDVVPVEGQPWSSDPFELIEKQGRYYGRGAVDMKGFLAIALSQLPSMKNLKKPIILAFSYDEEIGCLGAPRLIEAILQTVPPPSAVIVGEPSEMQLVTAHKGITTVKTTVTGREVHSSQPHRGVSAVMIGARLVTWLDDFGQRSHQSTTPLNFDPPYTTVHVGKIHGGIAHNIVARHCEFVWDIRNLAEDDPLEIVNQFKGFYEQELLPNMRKIAPEANIETTVLNQVPSLIHQPDSAAATLIRQLTGQNACQQMAYAAEAGQFQEAGLATVICGPGSINQAHQPDEFIEIAQIEQGIQFTRQLIEHLS